MSQLKILITGCTGNLGGALARALLKKGHTVRGITRKPDSEKARKLADLGAEIVKGDYDDPASLRKAVSGMSQVFVMGTPYESGTDVETRQSIAIVDAVKKERINHLLYASVSDADRDTGIPHFDSKRKVEKYIESLDIPFTIIAPVYFFDNILSPFVLPSLKKGAFAMSLPPERTLQGVAVSDGRLAGGGLGSPAGRGGLRGRVCPVVGPEAAFRRRGGLQDPSFPPFQGLLLLLL